MIGTSRRVTAQRKDGSTFAAQLDVEAWLDGRRIFAGIVLRDLSAKPEAAPHDDGGAQRRRPMGGKARFCPMAHGIRQPLPGDPAEPDDRRCRSSEVEDPDTRELVDDLSRIVRSTQGTLRTSWNGRGSKAAGSAPTVIPAGDILAALAQEFGAKRHAAALPSARLPRTTIACDPVLARRILEPLLDNAMTFTPQGKVLLGARRRGKALRLIVADTGVGIPADQLAFVFETVNQLDPRARGRRLGLGLAIARRFAALANLKASGRGSLFWLDVPRA